MVALRNPLSGMNQDEEAAAYTALLERRIVALTLNELRFRGLLELITGDKWDTMVIDFEEKAVERIALDVIMKRLGLDEAGARRILAEHKKATGNAKLTLAEQEAVTSNPQVAG